VQRHGRGGVASEAESGARRKEKKLTGGPGVSEEREGRRGCWLGPGQALGPGERGRAERGERTWAGLAEHERERKREGENGPARGRASPRGRKEVGRLPGLGSGFALLFPSLFLF
jgi:hypothetical protein